LLFIEPVHLKGIIFDIDGTLLDTNDLHARCWVAAFSHFGKEIDYDLMRHQIGKGGDLLVPDLLNAREMQRFGAKLKKYRGELYKREYMREAKPFPRIKQLFEVLNARGIKLALASSAEPDEVEYYTELLGVEKLLGGSTSTKDAKLSKPSPEIFEAALGQLGTDVTKTLVVGDTPYDVLAAHRASLAVAAVLCGGFERELLAKAEFLFDSAEDIEREIEKIDAWFISE
jgi:HAD superfamily hydrolase (TIGR01549 family)